MSEHKGASGPSARKPTAQIFPNPAPVQAPRLGREVAVPLEHVRKFWKLFDKPGNYGRWKFWRFVGGICPDTLKGNWAIKAANIQAPVLVEQLEPEPMPK
jgi:hypothetical protein